jgi:type 1 glutamine amidotransferase
MMTIRFTTDEHDSQLPARPSSADIVDDELGKGRVFVTTLGHGPDEVVNQGFVVTFSRGRTGPPRAKSPFLYRPR